MNSKGNTNQEDQKSACPPEYTIIHRQSRARDNTPQKLQQPENLRYSKRDARFDANEARREARREQRYRAKRRRQWALALGIVIVFIGLLALALYFISSRSTSTTPAASQSLITANPT